MGSAILELAHCYHAVLAQNLIHALSVIIQATAKVRSAAHQADRLRKTSLNQIYLTSKISLLPDLCIHEIATDLKVNYI
jgi:hypothetical protein